MVEDNIKRIVSEVKKMLEKPETFVPGSDRERFESYSDKWSKKKSISEVWRETDAVFFPLLFGDKVITKTRKLLLDNFDSFLDLMGEITTPYVLRDFLMLEMDGDKGWDIVLRILAEAPVTNSGDDLFEDEIESIVALVALDVLVWHIFYRSDISRESLIETSNEAIDEVNKLDKSDESDHSKRPERLINSDLDKSSKSLDRINQLAGVLKRKNDGFYLTYHYLKYLLWKEPKADLFYELLNVLENAFHDEANKVLVKDNGIIVEGLDSISDSEFLILETTGMLKSCLNDDVLINFRTTIRLIGFDEQVKKAFNMFKYVYLCNAQSFFTYGMKSQLKHHDIAILLISQDDMLSSWKEIQAFMRAELHRLSNKYFDDQSSNLRDHIKFMWCVNLRILEYLYREDSKLANIMWNEFWKDGLEYSRRFFKFYDNDSYKYLSALICYYYICFIKEETLECSTGDTHASRKLGVSNGASKVLIKGLMPYFNDIDNMPVLVLMAAQLLMSNGINWKDLMQGEYAEFFEESFHKALVWTKDQKQYEWVGQYLKKRGFVFQKKFP